MSNYRGFHFLGRIEVEGTIYSVESLLTHLRIHARNLETKELILLKPKDELYEKLLDAKFKK